MADPCGAGDMGVGPGDETGPVWEQNASSLTPRPPIWVKSLFRLLMSCVAFSGL